MIESEVRWQKLTREAIRIHATNDPLLIQPIGAIEQHGPHLPIDTDSNTVETIAIAAARTVGPEQALVLPTITWGLSPYWLPFPGTITLRPETILAIFADIGHSVAAHGFTRMLILNGHGGNGGIIGVAATQLADHGIRATAMSYWALFGDDLGRLSPGDFGHIGHAGQTETSLQLYLQPELVDPSFAAITERADLAPIVDRLSLPGAYAPPNPLIESPNGIYGDVASAAAGIGEKLIEIVSERLTNLIVDSGGKS